MTKERRLEDVIEQAHDYLIKELTGLFSKEFLNVTGSVFERAPLRIIGVDLGLGKLLMSISDEIVKNAGICPCGLDDVNARLSDKVLRLFSDTYANNERAEKSRAGIAKAFRDNKENLLRTLCRDRHVNINDEEMTKYKSSFSLIRSFGGIEEKTHSNAMAVFAGISEQIKNAGQQIEEQVLSWYNDCGDDAENSAAKRDELVKSLQRMVCSLFKDMGEQIKEMAENIFADSYCCGINAIREDRRLRAEGGGLNA